MAKELTYAEFIEYAEKHYTKGGDSYVECWDEKTFNEYVGMFGPITKSVALAMLRENLTMEREYEAAARWYAGEGY